MFPHYLRTRHYNHVWNICKGSKRMWSANLQLDGKWAMCCAARCPMLSTQFPKVAKRVGKSCRWGTINCQHDRVGSRGSMIAGLARVASAMLHAQLFYQQSTTELPQIAHCECREFQAQNFIFILEPVDWKRYVSFCYEALQPQAFTQPDTALNGKWINAGWLCNGGITSYNSPNRRGVRWFPVELLP